MLSYKPGKYALLREGKYLFEVIDEPEQRETDKGYSYQAFQFESEDEYGIKHKFSDIFFPFEERYKDLLLALGGIEKQDGEVALEEDITGKKFGADIRHEEIETKKGRRKMAKIANIYLKKKVDDSVPF